MLMFNMRIFTILSVIAVIFVLIGSVSATDIHVNDTLTLSASDNDEIVSVENDFDVLTDNPSTYSNLSNEIGSGEKYIALDHDYYTYDYGSTIEITSECVIDGKGATIDMSNSRIRTFKVIAAGVTIKNLTIKNVDYGGVGAIYFSSSGTVENCNFVKDIGGGIKFEDSGTVINCNFVNNTDYGSAIHFGGSGSVTNCNFTNNRAGSYDGGAIHFGRFGSVTNCKFTDNEATIGNGGAIHFGGSGSVTNCKFTNNSAPLGKGGAIYFTNSGSVENCKFTYNEANVGGAIDFESWGDVSNCNFTDNCAIAFFGPYGNDYDYTRDDLMSDYDWTYGNGGAVNFMDNGVVTKCNFDNNFGSGSAGGAIYFYSSGTVVYCNFTDNSVRQYFDGGAIYFNGSGNVENCNFIGNLAFWGNGGAIYFHSPGTVENCKFINNQASNDNVLSSIGEGGAIYFHDSGNVTNSNFLDNKAVTGSAIHFNTISSINTVSNSLFLNNKANADGLQVVKYGNIIEISFTGNDNLINAIHGWSVKFNNVTYWGASGVTNTGISTTTPLGHNMEAGQNITVIAVVNDIIVLNVTKITNNNGKIVLGYLANGIYTITARHYADSYYTQAETTETVVIGNTYSDLSNEIRSGGNITLEHDYYSYDQGPVISISTPDSVIDGNGAIIDMAGSAMSALKVSASNVTIKNLTIKNANYNNDGGAIYFSSSGTVENCIFVNNTAKCGGAIYFSGSGTVENCIFVNNTAKCGGAICFYSSSGTNNISNSLFLNNNLHADDNALLHIVQNDGKIEISFMGQDNLLNAIYSNGVVNFTNVTYWDGMGIANISNSSIAPSPSNNGAGLNITVIVVVNEDIILNTTKVTDENGKIVLGELTGGIYTITASHFADSYYPQVETTETVFVGNTYSDLSYEIGSGGNITLKHDYYSYDQGPVISISTPDSVIDGNGAIIDMAGSAMSALKVSASNVTIKNLTIKNVNSSDYNGAIYFSGSGTVENCIFVNNTAGSSGGAIYFSGSGTVENCIFVNNSARSSGGAIRFGSNVTVTNCNFVNNKATAAFSYGGAIIGSSGTVTNCSFSNNSASHGGAIRIATMGNVTNCNFVNNSANLGGSVYIVSKGEVTNCSFSNNSANKGGAIFFNGEFTFSNVGVTNCNFTDNIAVAGSAIYFLKRGGTNTISNSLFLNNRANVDDNTPLQMVQNGNNIEIVFIGQNNLLNAIFTQYARVRYTNVTYWGANGVTNTGISTFNKYGYNKEAGQNITVIIVVNGDIVLNATKVTDANGKIDLGSIIDGNYLILACHDADSYYTQAKTIITNMEVNITPITTNNKTVNITAKSNIRNDVIQGKFLFVLPNGTEITASYNADGTWWALYTFDDYGDYNVNASYIGGDGIVINNALISIKNEVPITNATSENVTDNNESSNSSDTSGTVEPEMVIPQLDEISSDGPIPVTLPSDARGTVILTVNGKDYNFNVLNGVANVKLPELANGVYPYTITYSGDSKYSSFTNTGSLKVNKTTVNPVENETNTTIVDNSKILASNKKVAYATGKYYTIKVYGKDGQFANGVEVVITVNGKTFKTLTTKDGIAKFKVTQKPGTYKMIISALNKNVTKTLTVKHLAKLKLVTVKKSAKKIVLQASLGKVNGKYLKGKTITFKFNGKVVGKVKTDKKGIAKVTIKSSVLKKLKVGKKVTYQATYNKDTVKKTVKVKR